MKKNLVYVITLMIFTLAVSFLIFRNRDKNKEENKGAAIYTLQNRKGPLAQIAEWKQTREQVTALLNAITQDPDDMKSRITLSQVYIREARISGNHAYYETAAMEYVNEVLKRAPEHFEALILKSLLYLAQHQFAKGLETAEKARAINPYNAFVYGLLIDAYVELGNYTKAVECADKMVSIRPDLRSYSRISYLREIHGDYPGAIEAMKMAVDAGMHGDESTEWARVQLGRLFEKTGDFKNAEAAYETSLASRPDYPYAIGGLARIAVNDKDYQKAIDLYLKADGLSMDNVFKEELIDVYEMIGDKNKAASITSELISEISKNAKPAHLEDGELANLYLKINNNEKALEHGLLEYNRRPDNIEVNETVAWIYYCKGDYPKALPFLQKALRTNSKDPELLYRARMIRQAVSY